MQYQINLLGTQAKKAYKYLFSFGGWILLFLVLWFKGCGASAPGTTTLTIPSITKVFPTDTIIEHKVVEVKKWYKDKSNEEKLQKDVLEMYDRIQGYQEEIDNMQSEFMWSDSIKKAEMFRLATELKEFNENYEDVNFKLNIKGFIGANKIKEFTPTITSKEKEIDVVQKQVKFRMLAGGGIGINKELNQGTWKANVGFQNKKGNIIRGSFQRIGNQDYYLAEYDFSIFKITK